MKFYVGFTKDLKQRFDKHQKGLVDSTKDRRPLKLVYYEACLSRSDATKREKYFKTYHGRMFIKRRLESYLTGWIWSLLMGRLADLTSLASTAMPSLIVRPCFSNWRRISVLIWSIASFDKRFLNRENVEWSGEDMPTESPKKSLKECLSFTQWNCLRWNVLHICIAK